MPLYTAWRKEGTMWDVHVITLGRQSHTAITHIKSRNGWSGTRSIKAGVWHVIDIYNSQAWYALSNCTFWSKIIHTAITHIKSSTTVGLGLEIPKLTTLYLVCEERRMICDRYYNSQAWYALRNCTFWTKVVFRAWQCRVVKFIDLPS
jgi:hypothetical protein